LFNVQGASESVIGETAYPGKRRSSVCLLHGLLNKVCALALQPFVRITTKIDHPKID
jgi:hypothetical protein